ncbi:MAG: hypothetical protein OER80_07445 [Gammaproteobacteria bacterium]|nr:hypothetical protein [Gammaproteobacteria bacterium]MDH3767757.1 hypothetical protein [Gammaproteobacteria bacterium]
MTLRRKLSWVFALLAVATLFVGIYALEHGSNWVLILALTPLFAVLALVLGLSAKQDAG